MKYSENKIIGFVFKLFEKKNVKNKKYEKMKKDMEEKKIKEKIHIQKKKETK